MMHGPLTDSDAVSQLRHALHANSTVSEPFEIVLYTSNGQFRQASYPLDRGAVEFRRDELRRTSTASNVVDEFFAAPSPSHFVFSFSAQSTVLLSVVQQLVLFSTQVGQLLTVCTSNCRVEKTRLI